MKLSLFNTLLLASSTLRAAALPSAMSDDDDSYKQDNSQLSIRTVDTNQALEFQNLGPWGGLALGLVGGFAVGIAAGLITNKIQKMIDGHQTIDTKEAYLVSSEIPGGPLAAMMARLAGEVARQLGGKYGVVISEVNALQNIQVPFYELQGVAFEVVAGQDKFRCDLFATQLNGYIDVAGRKPDNSLYLIESSGDVRLQQVNPHTPSEVWKFYFGA